MRYGHLEKGFSLWILSIIPLFMIMLMGMPFIYKLAVVLTTFLSFFAQLWPIHQIRKNRLTPLLDEAYPDETVWLRFTKDHIFIPQFVKKSTFGVTKGLIYGEKADVLDDGDFPVKTLNGNPAVITYDMMNTTIDLKKSLARRFMKKRYGIDGGVDGYNLARVSGKVMLNEPRKEEIEKRETKRKLQFRKSS